MKSVKENFNENNSPIKMTGNYSTESQVQKNFMNFLINQYLSQALKEIPSEKIRSQEPLFLSDYGTATGKNTIPFLDIIFEYIYKHNPEKEIVVILDDLISNNFSDMFDTIKTELINQKYPQKKILILASCESFYKQAVPLNKIDLGICSSSLHWLSLYPGSLPLNSFQGNPWTDPSEEEILWMQQAEQDLKNFFYWRELELAENGYLFFSILSVEANSNLQDSYQKSWAIARQKTFEKFELNNEELLKHFNINIYFRSEQEILSSLKNFKSLKLKKFDLLSNEIYSKKSPENLKIQVDRFVQNMKNVMVFSLENRLNTEVKKHLNKNLTELECKEITEDYFKELSIALLEDAEKNELYHQLHIFYGYVQKQTQN